MLINVKPLFDNHKTSLMQFHEEKCQSLLPWCFFFKTCLFLGNAAMFLLCAAEHMLFDVHWVVCWPQQESHNLTKLLAHHWCKCPVRRRCPVCLTRVFTSCNNKTCKLKKKILQNNLPKMKLFPVWKRTSHKEQEIAVFYRGDVLWGLLKTSL